MKYSFLLLLTLLMSPCFCQESMEVVYAYKSSIPKEKTENQLMDEAIHHIHKTLPNFPLKLVFNQSQTAFFVEGRDMDVEHNNKMIYDFMFLLTGLDAKYYNNLPENLTTTQKKFRGELRRYEESFIELHWTIHSEQKEILGYRCKMATTEVISIKKGEKVKQTITAWFTAELPYPFGPLNFRGLPGLILAVTNNSKVGFTIEAKEINLMNTNTVSQPNIKLKSISDEEIKEQEKTMKYFFDRD